MLAVSDKSVEVTQFAHPRVKQHRQPKDNVETICCKIFTHQNLACRHRGGQQPFQSAESFLLGECSHGDKREDEDEEQQEKQAIRHVIHNTVTGCLSHGFQHCLKHQTLYAHGTGENHPTKRHAKVTFKLFGVYNPKGGKITTQVMYPCRFCSCRRSRGVLHVVLMFLVIHCYKMFKFINPDVSFLQIHPQGWGYGGKYGVWRIHVLK